MATTTKAALPKTGKVDVAQAAEAARAYFAALFPGISKFSLEEVELSEDENYWLITLGFEAPKPNPVSSFSNVVEALNPPRTKYKVFKVDAHSGQVVAMKIRSLG